MRFFWLCLALVLTGCSNSKKGGTDVGGGGMGAEAEWHRIAGELSERVRVMNVSRLKPEEFERIKRDFKSVVERARVKFEGYPLIHGAETADVANPRRVAYARENCLTPYLDGERDAINFQSVDLVKVSLLRFSCYPKNGREVRRLVLHEYLGLTGVSDVNYEQTNVLLDELEAIPFFDDGYKKIPIKTCEEFQQIGAPGSTYNWDTRTTLNARSNRMVWVLQNDIDCADREILPRNLYGSIDGNGYKVTGLRVNPGNDERGSSVFEFVCARCTIANFGIEGAEVMGTGLLVHINEGTIVNSYAKGRHLPDADGFVLDHAGLVGENLGMIKGSYAEVSIARAADLRFVNTLGGLVSKNSGIVWNSYAKATFDLQSPADVGGLVGENAGSIEDSWWEGTIQTVSSGAVGGIAGKTMSVIKNSRAKGAILIRPHEGKRPLYVGGVAGFAHFPFIVSEKYDVELENSLADVRICGSGSENAGAFIGRVQLDAEPYSKRMDRNGKVIWPDLSRPQPSLAERTAGSGGIGQVLSECF